MRMGEPSPGLIYTCVCVLGRRKEAEGRTVTTVPCVWWFIGRSGSNGWHGNPIERQKSEIMAKDLISG